MSETRLNSVIRALESGKPAFAAFSKVDKQSALDMSEAPYDGVVFEMEHNPYDVAAFGDALQYMLNRKAIAESGSVATGVTPIARIPANGVEMNQSFAKQVLDRGAYGVPRAPRCTSPRACAATARPTPRATGASPWPSTTGRPTCGRWRRRARSSWA
jgi:4-hydroxy-2-oxoheptanedioate aldolase